MTEVIITEILIVVIILLMQVLKLLEDMNLGQYKKKFEEEQISGSLLLEIDDDILQNELGVTSKLHRLKILRIIEGRQTLFK